MSKIKLGAATLTTPEKVLRGETILEMSTDNPLVPGNAAVLATFADAQAAFEAAMYDARGARQTALEMTTRQDAAEKVWLAKLNMLAAFTESATAGRAPSLLSAGFEVRAEPGPTPTLAEIGPIHVTLIDRPGYSKLRWKREANAAYYLVQSSPNPADDTGWVQAAISTKATAIVNGAQPGQPMWYRVCAVNAGGPGPWSAPAARPVL